MNPARTSTQRGFSLTELAMMVTVCVLLIYAVVSGTLAQATQRRVHTERLLALATCRSKLEVSRSYDQPTLDALANAGPQWFDVPGPDGEASGLVPKAGQPRAGELLVTRERTAGGNMLFKVLVRIRWQGATRGGELSLETYAGDRR